MQQNSFDFNPGDKIEVTEVFLKNGDCEMTATILGNPDQIRQWLQDDVEITFLKVGRNHDRTVS